MKYLSSSIFSLLSSCLIWSDSQAFQLRTRIRSSAALAPPLTATRAAATFQGRQDRTNASRQKEEKDNFWLKDFSIASGEIIDPYIVLKIPRHAEASEIRRAYIDQSRRYHPDGARHRKFLPGSCNNIDEVREQWERIKLAYEILKTPQLRKRYDRHEALADPGRAVRRAATDAAVKSIVGLGKGLFDVTALAVTAIKDQATAKPMEHQKANVHESSVSTRQQQQQLAP